MENAERYLPESKGAERYPVFIFAGGTSHTYRDFTREDTSITENQRADFANAKGPDFVSRLSGHINILGPDPLDDYDEAYILRRAVFLRALMINRFNVDPKEDITKRIDKAIICALLTVTSYKHGMRSLRAILSMSSKLGDDKDGKIVSSTLPSLSQLNMHVDGNEFLARVSEYKKKE